MKDWFDGHSWASGLFVMNNGKSQESVSEAANAYYACALLAEALMETDKAAAAAADDNAAAAEGAMDDDGAPPSFAPAAATLAAGNTADEQGSMTLTRNVVEGDDPAALLSTSRVLFSLEVGAAVRYWQVLLHEGDEVYPSNFVSVNRMAGIVGQTEVVAKTWFGTEIEYVHCINMLPFTPATTHLLSRHYILEEFSSIQGRASVAQEPWRGFIFSAQAVLDPLGSWENLVALYGTAMEGSETGAQVDEGTSMAAMLYWAATRPPVL
jgi:endoglucanase Acf2